MKKLFSIIIFSFFVLGIGVAQDNEAKVDQTGTEHEAIIDQAGQSNEAEIIQTNTNNWAEIIQENDNNIVFIDQTFGSNNIAQIKQMGDQQHTFFFQEGSDNIFRLQQGGTGANQVGGDADNPFIQLGDHNKFAGVIDGSDGLEFDQDGYAVQMDGAILHEDSEQTGNYNKIGLHQEGASTGFIKQDGHNNEALLFQYGDGHSADITQTGDFNKVSVKQTSY